jgi:hypothetical protein
MSVMSTNEKQANENSKSFADIRLKLGNKRANATLEVDERDSLPSDLSGDEWTEIVNFQKEKFDEERMKKQEEFQSKRRMIKDTLDR